MTLPLGELIAQLQKIADEHGPDLEVNTEGCDCDGDVAAVEFIPGGPGVVGTVYPPTPARVYIRRSEA